MILTVDLEFLDRTRDEVERLLVLLRKYSARATFFVVTGQLSSHEGLIMKISREHEIASHSENHVKMAGLNSKSIAHEIEKSKEKIEKLGIECMGFRSPFNMPPADIGRYLKSAGYEYDSSLCNTYFPFRFNNRDIINKSYRASAKDIARQGTYVWEMPISNFGLLKFPALLSFLKLGHPLIGPGDMGDSVFSMHDYDLKEGIYDREAGFIVKRLQQIRSGNKGFEILESVLKRQSQVCCCKDHLEKLKN